MIKILEVREAGKDDMSNPVLRKQMTAQIGEIFSKGWATVPESQFMMRLGAKNCLTLYKEGCVI